MPPTVSVIVPCYNERDSIDLLLAAVYAQSYPRHEMELVIADGMSSDHTRQRIADFQAEHADLAIRLVDNPKRIIPAGLNCALDAASGEYIVRLDAHSAPRPDYIERSLAGLRAGRGWNVGGVWDIRPGKKGWLASAIARAAAHPLGVGDARYRYTDQAGAVDTVPFGAYRRDLVEQIGAYDESLLTNEDYEFNTRIRQAGGVVWLDPSIRSTYYARASLFALAKQYWRYGYWKVRMLQRYPRTLRWRQALPPLFVLSLVTLALMALLWPPAGWFLLAEVVSYALVMFTVGGLTALRERSPSDVIGVPLAIAAMHLSWGGAFLWSLLTLFWHTRLRRSPVDL